jgi:hypothetical protein
MSDSFVKTHKQRMDNYVVFANDVEGMRVKACLSRRGSRGARSGEITRLYLLVSHACVCVCVCVCEWMYVFLNVLIYMYAYTCV